MFEQFHGAEFLMEDPEAKPLNEILPTLCGTWKVRRHVVPLDTKPSGVNSIHFPTPHPFRIHANTTDFHVCLFVVVLSGVFQLFSSIFVHIRHHLFAC